MMILPMRVLEEYIEKTFPKALTGVPFGVS